MILTLKLKLPTTETQKQELLETMEAFNAACNYVSDIAYEKQVTESPGNSLRRLNAPVKVLRLKTLKVYATG